MRNHLQLFIINIMLILALNSCGPGQLSTATPYESPQIPVISTETNVSPTSTPTTPAPTQTPIPQGHTITVTSTSDSGPGTLRQAVLEAQSGDTITFDPTVFPPADPETIFVNSELPPISQGNLTIDASDAGVILDGRNITGEFVPGLQVMSNENKIQGMQIVNFSGAGIVLSGGAQNNLIGGDRSIGNGPIGQGNLTSGNEIGIGLWDERVSYNSIKGNLIGTDIDATTMQGNHSMGVYVSEGASHNTIGPSNIIAYNADAGIQIYQSISIGNRITQNSIHDNGRHIDLADGGNKELNYPLIFDFDISEGTLIGASCANCTVELFSDRGNGGKVYEGQTIVDDKGNFIFDKGVPFVGPNLTTTVTDKDGNTSQFSVPTWGESRTITLQLGNSPQIFGMETKPSGELDDNRIGDFPEMQSISDRVQSLLSTGYKWQRIGALGGKYDEKFWEIDWLSEVYSVDPKADEAITELSNNGVSFIASLGCLPDEEVIAEIGRFKSQKEIENFLSYVRQVVAHFKGRIQYYEIWNEPNVRTKNWYVELPDYINLVHQTIPVILEQDPDAKIVVGSTTPPAGNDGREYLFGVLQSDIMPLVDVVSWHPMYGTSPEYDCCRDYYYEYPSIVQEIKDVAEAHGFTGLYYAAELSWRKNSVTAPQIPDQPNYSEIVSAKYYGRGIVMHSGMNVIAGIIDWGDNPTQLNLTRQLSTIMAGAVPTDFPVIIQSDGEEIAYYTFTLPGGERLIALWTDGVATEDDPGINTTLTLPNFSVGEVVGIDTLYGFGQRIKVDYEDGNLVIHDFLVKDYPIIIKLSE